MKTLDQKLDDLAAYLLRAKQPTACAALKTLRDENRELRSILTMVCDDLRQLRMDRVLTDREWKEAFRLLERRIVDSRAALERK